MARDTLVDLFRDLERHRGEFLVYDDGYRVRRHTYADVTRAARGFARRLAENGIGKGDKVVLWGENRPEWVVCYWGSVIAGAVLVPIDYRSSIEFLTKVSRIVSARAIVVGDDVPQVPRVPQVPQVPEVPQVPTVLAGTEAQVWRFADLDWTADGPIPSVALGPDDVVQIVFTSGATAEPKGVLIKHRNILANTVPVEREVLKYKKYARPFLPLRFLNLLPLSHMFGQSMATNIPPMVDGTVIFMRSFNPHDIVRVVKHWRVSVIVSVPKILEVLRDHAVRVDPALSAPSAPPAPPAPAAPAAPSAPPANAARSAPSKVSIPGRWWRYRRIHRMFGWKFWAFISGAAPLPAAIEDFWKRLGFAVIQGYGLTETAPIVTLNHPFRTSTGSVGTPIGGVEVKIAEDGEILVRGENVTSGYFEGAGGAGGAAGAEGASGGGRMRDDEGWLHTGDIGEQDAEGRLFIKGRKKEMIVTPEGLNVFPDDVERAIDAQPGVQESAVVGSIVDGQERVHAVLVLAPGTDPEGVVRAANQRLLDHQRIRSFSIWTAGDLPRTEGTRKLKRAAIKSWVATGERPAATAGGDDPVAALLAKFAGGRELDPNTSLDALGLSSIERVELMVALEDKLQTRVDETRFAEATTVAALRTLVAESPAQAEVAEPVDFPSWNRRAWINVIRRLSLALWILPLARAFAWIHATGREHLHDLRGPVVFAANHQSHFDVPVILAALPGHIRKMVAPAMSKEFFKAHFFPDGFTRRQVFIKRLNYYLAAFFFNAFPLPQREAGARQTLRYIGEVAGDGYSILIFPEGVRSQTGEMAPFRGGIGMIGSRLDLPVVPVRLIGVHEILHTNWKMAKPGRVEVRFGAPLELKGEDYAALAKRVEDAVQEL